MGDMSTDPPNSRLFILCSKMTSEDDIHEAFDKFGKIEDIWFVMDRETNESKGVVYVKYAKSSEAALAMEEMNGKTLGGMGRALKVMIAHSREQGSRKEDDPERLQRLFIIVPKTATEEDIKEHFRQFGDIDYVSIVKKKDTGESKGVAYVKYFRAYHAAKAFEECNRSYKAVFARPRESKMSQNHETSTDSGSTSRRGNYGGPPPPSHSSGRWLNSNAEVQGDSRLVAFLHSSLQDEQIYRLFDITPGLVDIRPQANRSYYGMQKVLVEYNCPPAASYACSKLNGFEYPIGNRISVKPYLQGMINTDEVRMPIQMPLKEINGASSGGPQGGTTTISNNELATLTAALAKAEAIIRSSGLGGGSGGSQSGPPSAPKQDAAEETFDPAYCSVRLPPPQPLAAPTDEPTHRLFVVCQPGLPSMYALRDIFGRFGNLVEVYTLQGKNCGYVSYATKESADKAIKTLHFQEVCGMRIKVMVADPPRNERKRLRVDQDSDN
ncbi:RNA-binding protein 45 [Cimex lectularius]|uniref:RRM domain-containing protein n=1 Tax=Cimex lectularius TaxID=79782 RepID=A0A8I6TE60_CIMLE|nr:RNA-binding protein 45 [Cimex lectularius]